MRMLVTAAALIALCPAAYAWTTDPQPANVTNDPSARAGALSTSSSRSSSAALSNSNARAVSSQSQIQGQSLRSVSRNSITVNNNGSGQSSGQSGGQSGVDPATLAAWGAGHGGNGQLPAASAYAPSFYGANPCTGPASSLGAQFQLFGLSVGGQTMDRVCQLLELHQQAAALEYLCDQDKGVRNALARTGTPCIADRPASVTPVNDNPTPPAQRPKWCNRARPTTEASKAYVLEQCGS